MRAARLDTSSNSRALAASDVGERSSAGSRSSTSSSSAARCTADGKTSFERLAHVDVVVRVHVLARERRDHLVGVHVRRGARAGLEDVDRELVVELAGRDPVAGGGDPLGLLRVEQPELGVHARRGGLDPAEPARHRRPGSARRRPGSCRSPCAVSPPQSSSARSRSRLMRSSLASQLAERAGVRAARPSSRSFTRGRPCGSPSARSCASIASQPAYSTKSHAALGEQLLELAAARVASSPARGVLEQQLDRLGRVLLVRADHAARAALDPAGAVDAGTALPSSSTTRPSTFGITPRASSNGTPGSGDAAVADAAEDEPARDQLASRSVGTARMLPSSSATSSLRTTSTASTRPSPRIATGETRKRSDEPPRLALRRARGVLAQQVDVAPRGRAVVRERGLARRVELEVGRVDDHVGAGELAELLQLRGA